MPFKLNPLTGNLDYYEAGTAATVADTTSLNLSITGQEISGAVNFGTGTGVAAEGNHAHSGVYEPVDATIVRTGDVNYIDLTDGGATTLHSHAGGVSAPLFLDGTSDAIQLRVQGHSTQTSNLATWEKSTGAVMTAINGAGKLIAPLGTSATNFFIGGAGNTTTTGVENLAIGDAAMVSSTTSNANVALGIDALQQITTGANNMAIGKGALKNVQGGGWNVAIGSNAGLGAGLSGMNSNVFIGYGAGNNAASNTNYSVFIGEKAGYSNGGEAKVAIGYFSGYNSTGNGNIFLGAYSGFRQTTNANLLVVDNTLRASAAVEATNSILYGVMASTPASQTLRINAVTSIYGGLIGNEDGGTVEDFRWESDTEANMLFVDANADTDGAVYLGGTTNGVKIVKGGDITLLGTAKYERHRVLRATTSGTPASQAADVDFFTVGGLQFSSASDNYAYTEYEIPDDWDGTDIYFEVDWFPDSGAMSGTDTVEWIVEYRAIAEGEAVNNGTSVTLTITDSADYSQYVTKHARFTLTYNNANQPLTAQDHIFFKVHRNTGVANDFSGTVTVPSFEIVYNSKGLPTN